MEKEWRIRTAGPREEVLRQAAKFQLDPALVCVIRNRGIRTDAEMENYLYGTLDDVHDPFLMKDLEKAAEILLGKIREGKKIRVISDYDVDGVTSCCILVQGLRKLGGQVSYDIPDRMRDGYGMNVRMVNLAADEGTDTIITTDNGIAAVDAVKAAKDRGLTVIVTDHHEIQADLPPADAIVDPHQENDTYPFPEICGATVAYKLLQGLCRKMKESGNPLEELAAEQTFPDPLSFLDLVALATVCDVMPLRDENRICVREGLRKLEKTENTGLAALLQALKLTEKTENGLQLLHPLTTYDCGFRIGPCINACGRLESAKKAEELLLCTSEEEAAEQAEELLALNESRKSMTETGEHRAVAALLRQAGETQRATELEAEQEAEIRRQREAGTAEEPDFLLMTREERTAYEAKREAEREARIRAISEARRDESRIRDHVLVVYVPGIHESVAGIVAGRLKERFWRPVIVFTDAAADPAVYKGSGRSIEGYNMFAEIQKQKGLLDHFGGHPLAAGLTIPKENLEAFRKALNDTEQMTPEMLRPRLMIDVGLSPFYPRMSDIVTQLPGIGPFGTGNEEPVFAWSGLEITRAEIYGKRKNVMRLTTRSENGRSLQFISFRPDEIVADIKLWFGETLCAKILKGVPYGEKSGARVDVTYRPKLNEYRGRKEIQFMLQACRRHPD